MLLRWAIGRLSKTITFAWKKKATPQKRVANKKNYKTAEAHQAISNILAFSWARPIIIAPPQSEALWPSKDKVDCWTPNALTSPSITDSRSRSRSRWKKRCRARGESLGGGRSLSTRFFAHRLAAPIQLVAYGGRGRGRGGGDWAAAGAAAAGAAVLPRRGRRGPRRRPLQRRPPRGASRYHLLIDPPLLILSYRGPWLLTPLQLNRLLGN